jgi:hypothetical protein
MSTISRAILGAFFGLVLGATMEVRRDSAEEQSIRVPVVGMCIGALSGAALAVALGAREITGRPSRVIKRAVLGVIIALLASVIVWIVVASRQGEKAAVDYGLTALVVGIPLGGVIGGALGFLRRSAKRREIGGGVAGGEGDDGETK